MTFNIKLLNLWLKAREDADVWREMCNFAEKFFDMTTTYKYKPSRQECEAIFAASCVEAAARECAVTPDVMYERMSQINLLEEYILPCYEALHSESRKNVTADIIKTMQLWEERLNIRQQ